MPKQAAARPDDKRRVEILDAALDCFLTFGFAKTSMDDIAKRARVSRPLIYLKFKNKEDVFARVFDYLIEGRIERATAVANGKGSRADRLMQAFEIMLVEPWGRVVGHPTTADFYEMCALHLPQVTASYTRDSVRCAEAILGDREIAEVFFFATEGLHRDLPSQNVLRKRLRILIEQFARGAP